MIPIAFPLIFGLSLAAPVAGADDPLVLPVWPDKVPGDYGEIGSEHIRPPENAPTKDAKWLTNVTKPTITVFRPAKEKNTGAAMLISSSPSSECTTSTCRLPSFCITSATSRGRSW